MRLDLFFCALTKPNLGLGSVRGKGQTTLMDSLSVELVGNEEDKPLLIATDPKRINI